MALLVTVEQAACNALAAWLATGLGASVVVWSRWPDPDSPLPAPPAHTGAVSLIRSGPAKEITTAPVVDSFAVIHTDVSPRPAYSAAAIVDLGTAIAALNVLRASYEAHRVNTGAHHTADAVNVIVAPAATDQPTAEALADNLLTVLVAHFAAAAHLNPDGQTTLAVALPVPPGNLGALLALARLLLSALSTHYPARIYTWRVADVEQPVQLDVWTTYEAARDDVMARLVPLLHADASVSASFPPTARADPVREGTLVALGDGWHGYADCLFEEPSITATETAEKKREFRATYRGLATLWRLVVTQNARITRASLAATVTSSGPYAALVASAPGGTTTTTIAT